jgi:quercetin dioxygenase-like cupin family protein
VQVTDAPLELLQRVVNRAAVPVSVRVLAVHRSPDTPEGGGPTAECRDAPTQRIKTETSGMLLAPECDTARSFLRGAVAGRDVCLAVFGSSLDAFAEPSLTRLLVGVIRCLGPFAEATLARWSRRLLCDAPGEVRREQLLGRIAALVVAGFEALLILLWTRDMLLVYDLGRSLLLLLTVLPGQGHERHNHPDSDEILYVLAGAGDQMVDDGEPFPVRPGHAIWVPKGAFHSTVNTGWEPMVLLAVYAPAGAEHVLKTLPDYVEVPAGEAPPLVRS